MVHISIEKKVTRNLNLFNLYNNKRKELFKEFSPKESDQILYLLPWLLSVNQPSCPGFVPELKENFRVFGIESLKIMRKKSLVYKKLFKISDSDHPHLKPGKVFQIDGVYTIGSIGSIAQTSYSDCDIWICIDSNTIDRERKIFLIEKLNLIKDWFDENCKIPVYFFLSDIHDVKKGYFGKLDKESSGSAQKNILMEEFYRTTIVIMGRTPFWWVSRIPGYDYDYVLKKINEGLGGGYEYVDFGDLPKIGADEFLGASLWQLQKALGSPLKSVIKMALLKRNIDNPDNKLAADLLKERVMTTNPEDFLDPMSFTLDLLLEGLDHKYDKATRGFLKECFFLRCNMKTYEKKEGLRRKLVMRFIKASEIPKETQYRLSDFKHWDMASQMRLGKRLLQELFKFYRDISSRGHADIGINKRDLTVLGRKIASIYQKKTNKLSLVPKPTEKFNLIDITYIYKMGRWYIYAGNDRSIPLFTDKDIVKATAFSVWNNLFKVGRVRMEPNSTSVSLQEIINLSHKLKSFLGECDVLDNSPSFYLRKERIQKVFIVVSFEESHYEKDINNFAFIYKTTWGELFVKRITSPYGLQKKLKLIKEDNREFQIEFYLQRNCSYYEKIIRRTRDIVERSFSF